MKINPLIISFNYNNKVALLSVCLFLGFVVSGQQIEKLDFEQTVQKGLSQVPYLESVELNIEKARILEKQAKFEQLPSINFGANHGYNWGQSIDPFTNQFATDRIRTNNFYVRSTWAIFEGLSVRYRIGLSKLSRVDAEKQLELEQRNYKIKLAGAYAKLQLDILSLNMMREQLYLSRELLRNTKALSDIGRATYIDNSIFESLYANDSAAVLMAKNDKEYAVFVLQQMINSHDKTEQFKEEELDNVIDQLKIYDNLDLSTFPELELAKLQKEIKRLEYKWSKSAMLPHLYLNSALGTGYSGNNTELIGTEFIPKPFFVQMDENFYQTAVLTLNIPVFNHLRVRSAVKIAEVEMTQADLAYDQYFLELNNQIEQLLVELKNEKENAQALQFAKKANEDAFTGVKKQFENGVVNFASYMEARNRNIQAKLAYNESLAKIFALSLILDCYFE